MRPSPFLPPTPVYFTALAVVTTVLATVVAGNPAADAAYGLVAVGGFLLGTTIRQSTLRAEQAELRLADMERAEIERSKAARLAERAKAAREIHDILAHNLGALIVQLDAVNALLEGDHPNLDVIRPVLRDAHQHAVDGLAEARHAVSSLREDSEPLEVSILKLTEGTPGASLEISGPPRAVPADVAFMVRRIVQEAMTNAAKHAPGARWPSGRLSAQLPRRDGHRRWASDPAWSPAPGRHGRRLRAGGDARAGRADRGPTSGPGRTVVGGRFT